MLLNQPPRLAGRPVAAGPPTSGPAQLNFDPAFDCLLRPTLHRITAGLSELALTGAEQDAVHRAAIDCLTSTVRRKVSRLLLLELNAARVTSTLAAEDSAGRWTEFLDRAGDLAYWTGLEEHYPTLLPRLAKVISDRAAATLEFARRFAVDRDRLAALAQDPQPVLAAVDFGAGDSHRGGRTVAMLTLATGARLVYKPRALGVDVALGRFLDQLLPDLPADQRIRIPDVLNCATYGWSEFVAHRYCTDAGELRRYYRRIGHWLALARLFGTTDLHAENLIACGPTPIVVDCETLFTPHRVLRPSGAGDALDQAAALLRDTVLSSGLLPNRGATLGWRGVDISAGGALPDQQPTVREPQLVDGGTDHARLAMVSVPAPIASNLPSPQPDLDRYWPQVLIGFDELTDRLESFDRTVGLDGPLSRFADVDVRGLLRSTEVYAELGRMLWHPASLHDQPAAIDRASTLLLRHSEANPAAPDDPRLIAAEIEDLLHGDIPYYQTTPSTGLLRGPNDKLGWGERHDVLAEALARWRAADFTVDREVIRASLVCAYLNDGYQPSGSPMPVQPRPADGLDGRRRQLAADLLDRLVSSAICGDDGTVTWIAPVLGSAGWSVQQLSPDGYSGAAGLALVLAGYQHEVTAGRALEVPGVEDLVEAILRTLRGIETYRLANLRADYRNRPEPAGLYIGLGSQIWCWTALADLAAVTVDEALRHAVTRAEQLPDALAGNTEHDLLRGSAGAIVSLLRLADRTGDRRWLDLAVRTGVRLAEQARLADGLARWPTEQWPDGLGGLAHGATGIGWALARLAQQADRPELATVAQAAFAFEESLWDPAAAGWRDHRYPDEPGGAGAWCHGAVGIGLVSADLLRRGVSGTDHAAVLRRAAESGWRYGKGWNHTLCHGDLGCWELLQTAFSLGFGPSGLSQQDVDSYLIASIEQHGPASGLARSAFVPGLLPGLGGVAYQLLRMHPDCPLPSVLVVD